MDDNRQARDVDAQMHVVHDNVIGHVITRALGRELKRTRENTRLSQAQLVALMPSDLHVKTLASYEQGTRPCTVVRLCEITKAMDASPIDVLTRVLHRTELDAQAVVLHIDLHALTDDPRPELGYLRRWARARLAVHPQSAVARLDGNTLQEMAVLLGTTLTDLTSDLSRFALSAALGNTKLSDPGEEEGDT